MPTKLSITDISDDITLELNNLDNEGEGQQLTKDVCKEELVEINGWTIKNQTYIQICIHRLKYYRIINNFFFFEVNLKFFNTILLND